jgi:hypothetical protein
VNHKYLEEQRQWWARALLLCRELEAMQRERQLRYRLTWSWFKVGLELPYPLDSETAAAFEALKEHYVLTWDLVEEGDEMTGWVQNYFFGQGKTALPEGAYSLQEQGEYRSTGPTEEEVRATFTDEGEFQKFLTGEDYTYDLSDVTDQEFEAKWDSVYQAIKSLAASAEVREGSVMALPTVPHQVLREAPLVEGEWLDQYVVALAEWGARLQNQGYLLQEPVDSHPLAWHSVVDPATWEEAEASIRDKLWQQTQRHLARFPGRTRDIQGRLYLDCQDYCRWRGRKAKGELLSGLRRGLVVSPWNQWVAGNGGEGKASLVGVQVSRLSSFLDAYIYRLHQNAAEAERERRRRESLLEPLSGWKPGRRHNDQFQQRCLSWKEMAESLLIEVYSLHEMVNTIGQRYFDGHQMLFPSSTGDFIQLNECVEHLVEGYNLEFDSELENKASSSQDNQQRAPLQHLLDVSAQRIEAVPVAQRQTVFLVDISRADALDSMGEYQKALDLMYHHV